MSAVCAAWGQEVTACKLMREGNGAVRQGTYLIVSVGHGLQRLIVI